MTKVFLHLRLSNVHTVRGPAYYLVAHCAIFPLHYH
jgi:hypothetical protein